MSVLTSSDLSAIAERAEKATPGPWEAISVGGIQSDYGVQREGTKGDPIVGGWLWREEAEFIAAARTDVPALLEEVQRLREGIQSVITLWSVEDREAHVLADALQGLLSEVRACAT